MNPIIQLSSTMILLAVVLICSWWGYTNLLKNMTSKFDIFMFRGLMTMATIQFFIAAIVSIIEFFKYLI